MSTNTIRCFVRRAFEDSVPTAAAKAVAKTGALVRSWTLRATPAGRRRLALEHGALHSQTREPGLTDLDATGIVHVTAPDINFAGSTSASAKAAGTTDIPVHWYEVGPSTKNDLSVQGESGADGAASQAPLTIVFVHGFTLAGESWYRQFAALRQSMPAARLLTMDLRGHGQTGAVAPELCTVEGAAKDAIAVINERATEGPIMLVGHSLGGLVALNIARTADETLGRRIAGVVLIATSIDRLAAQGVPQVLASPVADAVRETIESSPRQVRKFREAVAALMAPSLAVAVFSRPTDYDVIEFHAAMIHETPLETFVGYLDDLQEHDEFAAAPYLKGRPGAVLVGTRDDVTPREQADLILKEWPDAELVEVPDAGHMLPLEVPDAVNAAIEKVAALVLGGRAGQEGPAGPAL
nr:alpha/beta hydrolase [Corynebacterium lactis]